MIRPKFDGLRAITWDLSSGTWNLESSTLFLYDGFNLIAELNALNNNAPVRTYVWGLDLSGSLQSAGGAGGLLFSTLSSQPSTHAAAFDGNGNVIGLVDMATGNRSATYEYGAFGETLIADGVAAEAMPFRFSTKYRDGETGLIFFPHRPYDPPSGRFLSKDPINEPGSQLARTVVPEGSLSEESNLYRYVGNEPVGRFDPWGLAYFAYRPLDSAAGKLLGVTGNKLDDRMNTMAAHEQLFFEDGKPPSNLGFFDDKPNGQVRSDRSSLKYKAAHDTGWNDCVMRMAVANVKPSTYCLLGKKGPTEKYNCQDWADAVRTEYRRLINDPKVVTTCCPADAEKKK
jgi:RHS repeat-associated protein